MRLKKIFKQRQELLDSHITACPTLTKALRPIFEMTVVGLHSMSTCDESWEMMEAPPSAVSRTVNAIRPGQGSRGYSSVKGRYIPSDDHKINAP